MAKNILIVGATSGLGRQLAKLYAEEGCHVGIIGRRENLLQEIKQEFGEAVYTLKADINDSTIGDQVIQFIQLMKGIDMIIVAASVVEFNHELQYEPEMKTVGINVNGFTRVINAAWDHFKQKGYGHIVGVTSIAAARGNKAAPAYHASKAFQSTYLESLRIKAKHDNNKISITELVPGYMDTAMGKGDRVFWMISVEKAARQSKKAIDKKKSRAFIPKRWWFVYHIQRLLPTFIYDSVVNGSWKLKRKT
jgi:short-subunit dehydrogenase